MSWCLTGGTCPPVIASKEPHVACHIAVWPHHETAKITHQQPGSHVCKTTRPLSEHNNNNNKKPLHQSFRLRDNNKIAVRHLKNWHQQLNQAFLKWLPGDIVQQLFPDALWVTLLSCDFSSHDSKALRWSSWMLWHIFPALISYQMKGLGDFPAGLCAHLNGVTWNNGSYIKKKGMITMTKDELV